MRSRGGIVRGLLAGIALSVALAVSGSRLVHTWLPFANVGAIAVGADTWRRVLAARYHAVPPGPRPRVSVVAPTYREDIAILTAAVTSWLQAGADEVIVVAPADEREVLRDGLGVQDPRVRIKTTPDPEKRTALALGIGEARQPIVVLCDSDTLWPPDLLAHLIAPFADPGIGGVAPRVSVIDAESSVCRLAAQAMLDAKFRTAVRALATAGGVSLLSGRTAAYRREALVRAVPALLGETFLGQRCRSGDDGRLTWLVLNQGYRTTFQSTARVWTMMPATFGGFARQRLRHGRNDYRRYLGVLRRGWLARQPAITGVTLVQKLLEPLSFALGWAMLMLGLARRDPESILAWNVWLARGRGVIPWSSLGRGPAAVVRLALLTGVVVYVTAAVKWCALATVARQGWGTRHADRPVAEGQSSATLRNPVRISVTHDGGAG